jgi:hypothetical protein
MNVSGSIKCGEILDQLRKFVSFTGKTLPLCSAVCWSAIPPQKLKVLWDVTPCVRNMDVGTPYLGYSWYVSILELCITVESPSSNLEASPAKS